MGKISCCSKGSTTWNWPICIWLYTEILLLATSNSEGIGTIHILYINSYAGNFCEIVQIHNFLLNTNNELINFV